MSLRTLCQALGIALYGAVCGYCGYIANRIEPVTARALQKCELRYEYAQTELRAYDNRRPKCRKEY